jgi:hypothetical protein
MESSMPSAPGAAASRIDLVGATASFLCAAHCALTPLLLAAMPLAGFEIFSSHAFDFAFAVAAVLLGVVAVLRGYRHHRRRGVLAGFGLASVLLLLGVSVVHQPGLHEAVLVAGGIAMGWTHLVNLRLLRDHRCAGAADAAIAGAA